MTVATLEPFGIWPNAFLTRLNSASLMLPLASRFDADKKHGTGDDRKHAPWLQVAAHPCLEATPRHEPDGRQKSDVVEIRAESGVREKDDRNRQPTDHPAGRLHQSEHAFAKGNLERQDEQEVNDSLPDSIARHGDRGSENDEHGFVDDRDL